MINLVPRKPSRVPFPTKGLTLLNRQSGLLFPSNATAGSDIRIVWSGANLLPRVGHTAIWKANYVQHTGYYAVTWHSPNTGTWDNGAYSFGAHPYPCDGTYEVAGQASVPTGGSGTVHYYETAGFGGADYISKPSSLGTQQSLVTTKSQWVTQARKTEDIGGGTCRHWFYPDLVNNSGMVIIQDWPIASMGSPSAPAFYIGASDWRTNTPSSGQNDETPSGIIRGIKLFNAALTLSDIQSESLSESNSPVTSAGTSALWYMNVSPTPTDVSDKSGAGHNPSWANANRPTLWES